MHGHSYGEDRVSQYNYAICVVMNDLLMIGILVAAYFVLIDLISLMLPLLPKPTTEWYSYANSVM